MKPIFHLSFPVRDLDEAVDFYQAVLGAEIGRRNEQFADALVFGAQVTLHNDPDSVTAPMPRTRHFGCTMSWSEWEVIAGQVAAAATVMSPATVSYEGEPREQGKLMITDPSGNLIELKAYRNPEVVLGSLAD